MQHFYAIDDRLPIILHTIGETQNQIPIVRDKDIKWNQFIWVKNGTGTFYSGDKCFRLSKGQGVFLRNSESHSYSGSNLHTAWCTFSSSENLLTYVMGDKKYLLFTVPDFLERETENLKSLARGNTDTLELSSATYSYVTELFAAIANESDPIIDGAKKFMKENFHRPLSLDEIAESVGLNRFSLCRYFKKHHNRSVINELKKIRVSAAKRMLRYSDEKIETVAALCGFENPSYFSLRFKEECSCTPLEYRNKYL